MKEQMKTFVTPALPLVGKLELISRDGKSLSSISPTKASPDKLTDPFFTHCYEELKAYLQGEKKKISITLDFEGLTPFQKRVLEVMKEVPYGKVASYKDLADKLNSKAYQAIGNACGNNPFLIIYPCHRIVGSKGPGGFAHGLAMKKNLLKLEGYCL